MRALLFVVLAGCVIGAPPGFSPGSRWELPLVDPLADGVLVTPLFVDGKGPFLVAIDPDAPITVLDPEVIARVEQRSHQTWRVIDEHDTSHPTFTAEVPHLQLGNLSISLRTVLLSPTNGAFDAYTADRRRLYGVIGRDVIADSLVFGFDRERGVAWLETEQAFKQPSGAQVLPYEKGTTSRGDAVVRRLVSANIDGASYDVHLDLGAVSSQLRQEHWAKAKLQPQAWNMTLLDEFGYARQVAVTGIAERVAVGNIVREHIGFAPYDDRRWDYGQLEGTLGLDFFRPYDVIADWNDERYYLLPRRPVDTATRIERWGGLLPASCRTGACVTTALSTQDGQAIAQVARTPDATGANLEVVLAATGADGTHLPELTASLPAGVDHFAAPLEARYAGATLTVVDISPFPLNCDGCIVGDPPLAP